MGKRKKESDGSEMEVRRKVEGSWKMMSEEVVCSIGYWRVGNGKIEEGRSGWRSMVRESGKEVEGE